jgi:hypothetical protein
MIQRDQQGATSRPIPPCRRIATSELILRPALRGDWLASNCGELDPPRNAEGGTRPPGALPKEMRLCRPSFSAFFKQSGLRWRNAVRTIPHLSPLPLQKREATVLPPTKQARPGAHFYFASGAGSMSARSCALKRSIGIVMMISRASSFRSLARRVAA